MASWSYWLSTLCDLPVAVQLPECIAAHVWRGRVLVRGACNEVVKILVLYLLR
jgi:hypothetical protein